jgi:pimeloyl-ACP methyl ester carboxylesterase
MGSMPTVVVGEHIDVHGRRLVYDVVGSADGAPLFFFHGTPMSRHSASLFFSPETVAAVGVRLISADRPGCGQSTWYPNRSIDDWPGDVAAIADRLELDRFSVLAYSGGAPYALATATSLAGRVAGTLVVSGAAPTDLAHVKSGTGAGDRLAAALTASPRLGPWALRSVGAVARRWPSHTGRLAMMGAVPPDRAVLASPKLRRAFGDALAAPHTGGSHGVAYDSALAERGWAGIGRPGGTWVVWHGGADRTVSALGARWLAERSNNGVLRIFPGEGHLSLLSRHSAAALALCATFQGAR